MNVSRRPHRRRSGYRFASAFTLRLALVVAGASWPGRVDGAVSAQEVNPCALLTDDELKPLAAKTSVAGVPNCSRRSATLTSNQPPGDEHLGESGAQHGNRAVRWRLGGSAALAVLALPVVGAAIAGLVHTSVLESPVEEAQVSGRVASHVHV